jgi:ferredoxin
VAQLFSLGIIAFMASFTARVPQNVRGKFYVDSSCIYCELCDEIAPSIFRECNEQGWAYVFKQPETPEELQLCLDAVGSCPTSSIGTDGDKHEH